MELSNYQKDILNFFETTSGTNIGVSAFAGTGKTFIIEKMSELSDTSDIYLAFNTTIAQEFKEKIKNPKTKVMTVHALAYNIMNQNLNKNTDSENKGGVVGVVKDFDHHGTAKLDNLKIYKIIDAFLEDSNAEFKEKMFLRDNFYTLYNLCRVTLTDMTNANQVKDLINSYYLFNDIENVLYGNVPTISSIVTWLTKIDEISLEQFDEDNLIDFTDMLYITYLKLKNKEWKVPYWNLYTNIYLDEAQDNNKLQINFLKYIKREGGRYIFVYDEKQSCYLFNGADAHALREINRRYSPIKTFDLPVNYRCPTSHLDLVNKEFGIPIKARAEAPKGTIKSIKKNQISNYVKPGDMVISRKNKWLSTVVTDLTKKGIPIYIQDKENVTLVKRMVSNRKSKDLKVLKKQLEKDIFKYNEYIAEQKIAAMKQNGMTEAVVEIENTNSKIDNTCFLVSLIDNFIKEYKNISIRDFITYLDHTLSVVPSKNAVMLSSVHKAKGLEAENVFILNEGKICKDFRNSEEQNEQEKNLRYISITRAKKTLYFVKEPENGKEEDL